MISNMYNTEVHKSSNTNTNCYNIECDNMNTEVHKSSKSDDQDEDTEYYYENMTNETPQENRRIHVQEAKQTLLSM